ncbi:MAG: T9SS type A sorting domain-containing protein [Flavobacteriales bacterium]|nr:T9SS type A sorting domain-containing protein [Flavobacteriales bacterium]
MKNYFFLSLLLVGPHLCVGQQQVQFNADPSPQPMNQCVLVNQSNIGSMPTTLYAPNCIECNDQNTSNILINEAPDLFHTKAGKSIHMRSNVHIKPNAHFEIDEDVAYKFILFDEDWKSASSDSDFIDPSEPSRVEMDKVEIYPNPNKGKFSILLNTPVRDISVFNSLGLIVYTTESAQVGRNDIDLNVSSGIYTVRITLISNESIQKKLVIQ